MQIAAAANCNGADQLSGRLCQPVFMSSGRRTSAISESPRLIIDVNADELGDFVSSHCYLASSLSRIATTSPADASALFSLESTKRIERPLSEMTTIFLRSFLVERASKNLAVARTGHFSASNTRSLPRIGDSCSHRQIFPSMGFGKELISIAACKLLTFR